MKDLMWLKIDGLKLILGFRSFGNAILFIKNQSPNVDWRAQWSFRETHDGAIAETTSDVVLRFQ